MNDASPGEHVCEGCALHFRFGHLVEECCRDCGRKLAGQRSRETRRCFPSCEEREKGAALVRRFRNTAKNRRRGREPRRGGRE